MSCFIHFRIFPRTSPTSYFPQWFVPGGVQMAYGYELHISKAMVNETLINFNYY